jgi:hypothetical protein
MSGCADLRPQLCMLKYKSGEAIQVGDRVEYEGVPAEVEFIVSEDEADPALAWYRGQFGSGVMLADQGVFGSVFVSADDLTEDVLFVSRAES